MSIEMPTIEPQPEGEIITAWAGKLAAEKAEYVAKEALVTAAKSFEAVSAAVMAIGPFESSGAPRTPEEIVAKIRSLENAKDQKEVDDILQTIPRKFSIRGTVMDIMGIK